MKTNEDKQRGILFNNKEVDQLLDVMMSDVHIYSKTYSETNFIAKSGKEKRRERRKQERKSK